MQLRPPASPRLPDPSPSGISSGYVVGLINTLRLYFNQVSNMLQLLFGPRGGQYIDAPGGLFFDILPQTIATAGAATPVRYRHSYLDNGIRVNSGTDSRIYVDTAGVYSFAFSGQLTSNNSSSKVVFLWIVLNGTDVGYSTHAYTISGSGTQLAVNWNFTIAMAAGDYLELEWTSMDTAVSLSATASTPEHPGIPSAVMSVTYASRPPTVLPTPP